MNNKLKDWIKLSDKEKRIYNGYNGFVKSERISEGSAFNTHLTKKSKLKAEKEKWRN